jgi:peptidoglycan/LPS O-acetylase OafA/YrhL
MGKNNFLYLPGLNGLRAISSLAVVVSHTALAMKKFNVDFFVFGVDNHQNPLAWQLGSHGVTIFFVLSGFLITYLLILEKKSSPINIKKFYIRRVLRIWPIYYLYLIICLIVYLLFNIEFSNYQLLYYIFFTANIPFIFEFALHFLDHYWSIGVEEQFYLAWPFFISKIKKNLILKLICIVVIINVIRYLLWYLFPYSESAIFSIVNRFDCMIIGGIGALLFESKSIYFDKIMNNKFLQILSLIGLITLALNYKFINAIVDTNIVTIIALVLIVSQININTRILNFDNIIFNFLGRISYGIYVYHPLIIFLYSLLLKNILIERHYKALLIYFLVIATTLLVAFVSNRFFEKKFIKIKNNFALIKSTS